MVIFILRHADRSEDADTLSPAGVKRARFLAHMLSEAGVSLACCSDAMRTKQTLAPLKQALGDALPIKVISAEDPGGPAAHIAGVVAAIDTLPPGAVAVVVSHSNTVGPIIQGLGGGPVPPIADSEFDRLFVVISPPDGGNTVLHLRY